MTNPLFPDEMLIEDRARIEADFRYMARTVTRAGIVIAYDVACMITTAGADEQRLLVDQLRALPRYLVKFPAGFDIRVDDLLLVEGEEAGIDFGPVLLVVRVDMDGGRGRLSRRVGADIALVEA